MQMRKEHVIWLVERILQGYQINSVTVRNATAVQFIAHAVRKYLKEKRVVQEFIHVVSLKTSKAETLKLFQKIRLVNRGLYNPIFRMTQNADLEIKVIKRFVSKAKQHRYILFVSSPKNRHKFIRDLSHFNFFQLDLFEALKGIEEQAIVQALQENGVADKTCYVISENKGIDTKTLDTKEAISKTVGFGMGTILVFGDADMIYYESEAMNTRYISKK